MILTKNVFGGVRGTGTEMRHAPAAQQAGKSKALFVSDPFVLLLVSRFIQNLVAPTKVKAIAPTPPSKIGSEELTKSTSVVLASSAESQHHRSEGSLAKP
jgi:hypothetical protein